MGKGIVRVGDKNDAGGAVISGDNTVRVDGKAVAIDGSPVTAHNNFKPPHTNARCRASKNSVRVNGKRLIFVGDIDTCGHVRIEGSTKTNG
jgi:uncharacterized Zn-binding protein involved in type VI secretion